MFEYVSRMSSSIWNLYLWILKIYFRWKEQPEMLVSYSHKFLHDFTDNKKISHWFDSWIRFHDVWECKKLRALSEGERLIGVLKFDIEARCWWISGSFLKEAKCQGVGHLELDVIYNGNILNPGNNLATLLSHLI